MNGVALYRDQGGVEMRDAWHATWRIGVVGGTARRPRPASAMYDRTFHVCDEPVAHVSARADKFFFSVERGGFSPTDYELLLQRRLRYQRFGWLPSAVVLQCSVEKSAHATGDTVTFQ